MVSFGFSLVIISTTAFFWTPAHSRSFDGVDGNEKSLLQDLFEARAFRNGISTPFTTCWPDSSPDLKRPGFCASLLQLDALCYQLEISQALRGCATFEGNFCCYLSLAQGNTLANSNNASPDPVIPITQPPTTTRAAPVPVTTIATPIQTNPAPAPTQALAIPPTTTEATTTTNAPTSRPTTVPAITTTTTPTTTPTTTTPTTTPTTTTPTTTRTTTTPTTTPTTTTPTTTRTTTTPTTTATTTTPTTTKTTTTPTTTKTTTTPTTTPTTTTPTTTKTTTTPTTTKTTTTPTTTKTTTTPTTTSTTTTTTQKTILGPSCTSTLDTSCPATQNLILDLVNNVRRQAQAANMLKMVWDPVAAAQAQAWSDKCVAQHGPDVRNSSTFGSCGQNIANGNGIQSWNFTFFLWDAEINLFTFDQNPCPSGIFESIGHYTQDVWATSYQIGCGFTACPNPVGNFFVCNYCPPGNSGNVCKPYLPGTAANGGVCGKCGGLNSATCENGLCTTPCPFSNTFSNCDVPDAKNPSMFPALISDTSVCSQTNNQFVKACQASCKCREQGLIY